MARSKEYYNLRIPEARSARFGAVACIFPIIVSTARYLLCVAPMR